jgi:uncharacterized protein
MAAAAQDISPSVVIANDKMSAQIVIHPACDRGMLTEPILKEIIRARSVEVTDFTSQALHKLLDPPPPDDQTVTVDIACAQPPIHGADGSIQWLTDKSDANANDKNNSEDKKKPNNSSNTDQETVSFYDQSAYVMVETGDVIARISEAIIGQDGRDVTGATIPAKSGKEVQFQTDESIMRKADGSLIAQQDGVLNREPGKAKICKRIEIKDYVDFSTGNLEFDGDISVGRGVRDCFKVQATGSVEVKGLIEAATIETGNDLIATGGFAGRERGYANIGRDLKGKYLDNVQGHVNQDLCIDREVINCELTIDGKINSTHGSIIGGKITPTGEVNIGTLGSAAGVETTLVIGSVPRLEPFAEKLDAMVQTLSKDSEKLTEEQNLINKMSAKGRMTATDRERQTEIMFELSTTNAILQKAQRTLDSVSQEIEKRRCVNINISRMVNHGVILIYGQVRYKITTEFKGPARIFLEGKNQLVYRQGDSPSNPLSQIADTRANHPDKNAA